MSNGWSYGPDQKDRVVNTHMRDELGNCILIWKMMELNLYILCEKAVHITPEERISIPECKHLLQV